MVQGQKCFPSFFFFFYNVILQVAPLQQPPLSLRLQTQPQRRRPLLHQASAPVTQAEMRRVHMSRTELVKE